MSTLNDQLIAGVMQAYVDAMSSDDVEKVLVLFADDAVVEDPVGSDAHCGKDALRIFYQASIDSVDQMVLEGSVRAREKWGAAAMIASPKGIDMQVETLDVMEFNDEGLIARMTAYWGDTNLRVK
jgi:steroid delta-isomerase